MSQGGACFLLAMIGMMTVFPIYFGAMMGGFDGSCSKMTRAQHCAAIGALILTVGPGLFRLFILAVLG